MSTSVLVQVLTFANVNHSRKSTSYIVLYLNKETKKESCENACDTCENKQSEMDEDDDENFVENMTTRNHKCA